MPAEIQDTGALNPAIQATEGTISPQIIPQESPDSSSEQQQQTPPSEPTPNDILIDFENHLSSGSQTPSQIQPDPNARKGKGKLNPNRKYDGLEDNEKAWFDQMSNPAYENLYPKYLEAKKQAEELETLRNQNKQLQEVSFYDQEGAWEITPEYKQYSQAVNMVNGERSFWRQQLANIRKVLKDPENNKTKIYLLSEYDQQGKPVYVEVPANEDNEAIIQEQLNLATNLSVDYNNKLQGLQNSFKGQHQNYMKGLNEVRNKIFHGFDQTKLSTLSSKKLENFPAYTRNRPEIKMLAEVWVLFDALIHALNKNKANGVSTGIKNNIAANAGPAGSSGAGGGSSNGETAEAILAKMAEQGMLMPGRR